MSCVIITHNEQWYLLTKAATSVLHDISKINQKKNFQCMASLKTFPMRHRWWKKSTLGHRVLISLEEASVTHSMHNVQCTGCVTYKQDSPIALPSKHDCKRCRDSRALSRYFTIYTMTVMSDSLSSEAHKMIFVYIPERTHDSRLVKTHKNK